MDYFGPAMGALLFVLGMSLVKDPVRKTLNAVLVAGSCGVYLSGGFGFWELLYPVIATPLVYRGLQSYRFIGLAWMMHAAWDLPHHLWGNPVWPFMPTFSFGANGPEVFDIGRAKGMIRFNEMIFDTDVLLWASRGNLRAARTIDAAADRALSIVSFMELLQGARSKLEGYAVLFDDRGCCCANGWPSALNLCAVSWWWKTTVNGVATYSFS